MANQHRKERTSLGKCRPRPRCGTNSYPWGWLRSKNEKQVLARMWRRRHPGALLVEMKMQPSWKTVRRFLKKFKIKFLYDLADYTGYISERTENRVSRRHLYIHIHSGIIHNGQKGEATQVPTNEWMGQQNVARPYNGVLFSRKKPGNSSAYFNMSDPDDIMLSEINQSRQVNYCMIPLIWGT